MLAYIHIHNTQDTLQYKRIIENKGYNNKQSFNKKSNIKEGKIYNQIKR